jgi:hypothetical protein
MYTPQSRRPLTAIAADPVHELARLAGFAFLGLVIVAVITLITSPAWADDGEGGKDDGERAIAAACGWPRTSDCLFDTDLESVPTRMWTTPDGVIHVREAVVVPREVVVLGTDAEGNEYHAPVRARGVSLPPGIEPGTLKVEVSGGVAHLYY